MKKIATAILSLGVLCALPTTSAALDVVQVTKNVYALVGPLEQRTPENLGNNATFGVIVTSDGVVLVDPGGSAKGAAVIEKAIATFTDAPVRVVINTGGQDHRWFGNAYFKAKGATVIASAAAVEDQRERSDLQWQILQTQIGKDGLTGTRLEHADTVFDTSHILNIGGERIEIIHPGQAHTPGDSFVWLADRRIVFSGDIVYLDRMLGVLPYSNSASWLDAFSAIEARDPATVIPGHGKPAPFAKARTETRDYLRHLRKEVGALLESGGTLIDAKKVDQSAYAYLALFEQLSRRNAQAVFSEMEFE